MNSDVAIKFLSRFFAHAQGDVYISSLPNERGQQPPERHIITRDTEKVARQIEYRAWHDQDALTFYQVLGKHLH